MGLAPLHQGAQVERPESARPSRLGSSPTLTCLGAGGERGSPLFWLWGESDKRLKYRFGVLVSQLAALGGRGLAPGRGGNVPDLKCLFSPSPPPSLFWVSLAPGLTQFLSYLGGTEPARSQVGASGWDVRREPVSVPWGSTCGFSITSQEVKSEHHS